MTQHMLESTHVAVACKWHPVTAVVCAAAATCAATLVVVAGVPVEEGTLVTAVSSPLGKKQNLGHMSILYRKRRRNNRTQ